MFQDGSIEGHTGCTRTKIIALVIDAHFASLVLGLLV